MRGTLPIALLLCAACTSGSGLQLVVEVRTDLEPATDFARVRVELLDVLPPVQPRNRLARPGDDFVTGIRVAELPLDAPGTYTVRGSLVDAAGMTILARRVRVVVEETTGVVVDLASDCLNVICPGADEPADRTECYRGRCVTPDCQVDDPRSCGGCRDAADCAPPVSCAEPSCVDERCSFSAQDDLCSAGQACDIQRGCVLCGFTDGGGGHHCGDDWMPADGVPIQGEHIGVGHFEVPAGATVTVVPRNGESGGEIRIEADSITIAGILTAEGSGYRGGDGGDGADSGAAFCGGNGGGGDDGSGPAGGLGGGAGSGNGGSGCEESCRGSNGEGGGSAADGGYAMPGMNGDTSVDESVLVGSGGGGGGGGGGGSRYGNNCDYPAGTGGGGGGGARGGGAITLIAERTLTISGELRTMGWPAGTNGGGGGEVSEPCDRDANPSGGGGGGGDRRGSGGGGGGGCQTVICTASMRMGVTNTCGGDGGGGGSGGGGGVLLEGADVTVTGRIDTRGGDGLVNGGTLKVFYGCSYEPGTYETGRTLETRTTCPP